MNSELREAFIELHSQPILQNLRDNIVLRAKNVPEVPKLGDLDLNAIRDAEYFFN